MIRMSRMSETPKGVMETYDWQDVAEDLQERIDKAIEYIEKYKREGMGEEWFETSTPVSYLLKTLKGDSDE